VLAAAPEMGAAARRRCLARFEIGVVADQWRDLLDQVSRQPGPKAG
jgi:hypothetical protein